ncbi:hypothetical protein SELMODRAFT_81698 [Selaginella moellendorffii]|uniref:Pentacotripeptide-repeat region of PRORP domain-containing protein n=1 Tax=Selaginella moellendorffii TaxID=88036 RepID=D8QZ76_SELML|nr:hypothetical protein SELMODRAFT_81698 [Selaginella moellendorffii]
MEAREVQAEISACAAILTACSDLRALPEGKRVHGLVMRESLLQDERPDESLLENIVIQMYLRCGCTDLALDVFDRMKDQNVVAWTSLISAFTFAGHFGDAMVLFVHECIVEAGFGSHTVVGTAVLGMYSKCRSLELARAAFESIEAHDRISYTAMITAYSENSSSEALVLFHKMVLEGVALCDITLASALNACGDPAMLRHGKVIHGMAGEKGLESDMVVGTALVNMYSKCGEIEQAKVVFDRMIQRDVVLWTAMIGGYAENGQPRLAFDLFRQMQQQSSVRPNRVTYLTLANACSEKAALPDARFLHAKISSEKIDDPVTVSAVVSMYGRCGSVGDARQAFKQLKHKCAVAWNSIIAVHTQNGDADESLELLGRMLLDGSKPDRVTFISVLSMCSHAGLVKQGCEIFTSIRDDHRLEPAMEHYSCVTDMLGRAGWLEEAENFVKKMGLEPDDGIWACLLGACKMYGDVERSERIARKVLELQPHNSEAYIVLCNSLKDSLNMP